MNTNPTRITSVTTEEKPKALNRISIGILLWQTESYTDRSKLLSITMTDITHD